LTALDASAAKFVRKQCKQSTKPALRYVLSHGQCHHAVATGRIIHIITQPQRRHWKKCPKHFSQQQL